MQPTKTYKLNTQTKRIIGFVDENEAMEQAILKSCDTEKMYYDIYTWFYGIELESMVGEDFETVSLMVQDRITQSLQVDDRVITIRDFVIEELNTDECRMYFNCETIFGDIPIERTLRR